MRYLFILACSIALVAESPSPLPSPPLLAPRHVIIDNPRPQTPAAAYFPTGQITGVWQGCGPSQSMGTIEDFNSDHPRARIVQVFIDASVPCKTPTAHTFVIVYQEPAPVIRRAIRKPMK
ncbi:MAG TPA: hypothetical protein VGG22_10585 [Candidatus Baltobacteraceae bacterium]|jgi:hypothetical protein